MIARSSVPHYFPDRTRFARLAVRAVVCMGLLFLASGSQAQGGRTPSGRAQAPAWSRGFQLMRQGVIECSNRAERALANEGYNVTNKSNPSEDAFFVGGQKGNNSAVIMCDKAPGGAGTWVNIVVATSNTSDNGLPGTERQNLLRRIIDPSAPPVSIDPPPGHPPVGPPTGPAIPIGWGSANAQTYRGQIGKRITFTLPPNGSFQGGCFGTNIYTDDSSIGPAAVHAGLITFERGGTVTIEIRNGQSSYTGSRQNGMVSTGWSSFAGSFVFVGAGQAADAAFNRLTPTVVAERADWGTSPGSHRGQIGSRYTYTIPPNGNRGYTAYGTDLYTDDSSIGIAAVHAGVITLERGGKVTIEIRPGTAAYTASTRNGVTTNGYHEWGGSFVIVK